MSRTDRLLFADQRHNSSSASRSPHIWERETPCADVLAPHARLEESGGQKEGGWLGFGRSKGGGAPSPSHIYIESANGPLPYRSISNPNRSWINIHMSL